jgi:7-keto-8-aminopelargonate synthetase-like enzyme
MAHLMTVSLPHLVSATLCSPLNLLQRVSISGNHLIYSDEANHGSMVPGIKASGAEEHIFPHNDAHALGALLARADLKRPKLIITKCIFSTCMGGTHGGGTNEE